MSASWSCHAGLVSHRVLLRGLVEGGHHLAVHVELELAGRRVADAHRARRLVAGKPTDLELVQPAFATRPVHDLQLGGIAGHGAEQPAAPLHGFLVEPATHQGFEGEGGVAQPAEPVVPVTPSPERLGQGGGRRRNDPSGRLVGECLQGDQRADDRLAVLALVVAV